MIDPQASQEQISPEPRPKIESEKQACDLAFFSSANEFAQNAIAEIPELQAVAIIPLWAPQLENVPAGLLRLRNETPPYLAGLLQMLGRLSAFGVDVHRDMFTQMKAFDNMASGLLAEIRARSETLQQLEQQSPDTQ